MAFRKLLLLDLVLLSLIVIASRIALVLHEFVGHGLMAVAFGGGSLRPNLSLFGGGTIAYEGIVPGSAADGVIAAGGIAVNLVTGAIAWAFARRAGSASRPGPLFLRMLGAGSVGQALFYLANGFYFGSGDPHGFVAPFGDIREYQALWIACVPAIAFVAAFALRGWLDFLGGHATLTSRWERAGWSIATMGVALAAYVGLWALTWTPGADLTLRGLRTEQEIAVVTAERVEAAKQAAPPSTTPAPIVEVTPEDVQDRVPRPIAPWVMLGAALLGAGWTLRRWTVMSAPGELPPKTALLLASAAAASVGIVALCFR